MANKLCKNCSREIITQGDKFCGRNCYYSFMPMIENVGRIKKGERIGEKTEFKKGMIPHNKGLPFMQDSQHPFWKGSGVSYTGLHQWVSRKKGNPMRCSNCKTEDSKRFEWANIDRKYARNLNDYVRLCVGCHRKYDHGIIKLQLA